jgi:hypothetical protein
VDVLYDASLRWAQLIGDDLGAPMTSKRGDSCDLVDVILDVSYDFESVVGMAVEHEGALGQVEGGWPRVAEATGVWPPE